jgi:hypothetical protein
MKTLLMRTMLIIAKIPLTKTSPKIAISMPLKSDDDIGHNVSVPFSEVYDY